MNQQANSAEAGSQYLSFILDGDAYGVDILRVQEIRGWEPVRALPDMPPCMKGVLDLRGTIVPIIDLRVRFGASDPQYDPTTVIIIVSLEVPERGRQLAGMVVDAVSGVIEASEGDIKPPPGGVRGIDGRYLTGMVSSGEGMTVLIDVDQVLGADQWQQVGGLTA